MKEYRNGMKATEFNKFNLKKLYRSSKEGIYSVEKTIMSEFYDLADYYGHDDNGTVANDEAKILKILKAVEFDQTEEAQELINEYTKNSYELSSVKRRKAWNREFVA